MKTRTKWRTIFESLIIPTPGVVLKPNEKVPYYLKFLLDTGILPFPDSPIPLDVNHLDADVNEITAKILWYYLSFFAGRNLFETYLCLLCNFWYRKFP